MTIKTQQTPYKPLPASDLFGLCDRAYWAAIQTTELALDVSVATAEQWQAWASQLRREARGYWHGYTGRISERLKISDPEWIKTLEVHQPDWRNTKLLGDAVFDLFFLVCRKAGLMPPPSDDYVPWPNGQAVPAAAGGSESNPTPCPPLGTSA